MQASLSLPIAAYRSTWCGPPCSSGSPCSTVTFRIILKLCTWTQMSEISRTTLWGPALLSLYEWEHLALKVRFLVTNPSLPVIFVDSSTGRFRQQKGNQRFGSRGWAKPPVADPQQRDADGARAEGRKHGFQPGHPLRQQDELPAAASGHQQEPAAEEFWPRRRGKCQQ